MAFVPDDRWVTTASGLTGQDGDPITLTWSLVPDGTALISQGPSDLISFMDMEFGAGSGGSDLTQRPWFQFFEESFGRWAELGGINYVYEPNDDSATQGSSSFGSQGLLGVRGDIRIGGAPNDGPGDIVAFNYRPDNGDMVLDTDDGLFFSNPFSNNLRLRNTIMHEAGHGFGLLHVESSTSGFLLEPSISTAFDGPQFDDIRGLQWFYGDALEKTNGGQGNDIAANATSLGLISSGSTVSIGTDAVDTLVSPTDTDFISIDRNTDIDFFSFTTSGPSLLDVVLSPLGPTYNEGEQNGAQSSIDTSAISNLTLTVFDTDGFTMLGTANSTGAGFAEMLTGISLPAAGDYFVRITGDDEMAQFYQLDVTVEIQPSLDLWEASFGLNSGGDFDTDGDTDGFDFLLWQRQFDAGALAIASSQAVPEPSTALLALLASLAVLTRRVSK
ncbi:MAG: matrixin family metalloprotease [Planctomycetes bacterium]|nr:matrixin family metalloprotease [Planctomycetota bacterium]